MKGFVWRIEIKNCYPNWIVHEMQMHTVELIHGKRTPMVKMPNSGPFVIASKLIVNWSTVPNFWTTTTRATQTIPITTTTIRIIQLMAVFDSGFFTNGLTKSSSTIADMEFKQVDSELSAALKTPATNKPVSPWMSPRVSMTNSGKSWSLADANLVVNGSQSL